jgi:hypothetical protein
MICCNDIPDIKPSDTEEFKEEYQLKSKFVDKNFDESKKLATFEYYEKEEDLKSDYLTKDNVINEFTIMIIEAYNTEIEYPKLLQEEIKDNEDDDDMKKLFDLFDYTGEKDDFISNEDLRQTIIDIKIPFSLKKSKLLLKTKGVLECKNKKGDKRGLSGLKNKNDNKDDDIDKE